jgi:hypothetical protein
VEGQGDSLVDQFGDQGVELLLVMQQMNGWRAPTQEDCQALQATQKSTVLWTPDEAVTEVLGIRINMGAALVDASGVWLSSPVGEESYGEMIGALYEEVRSFGGF